MKSLKHFLNLAVALSACLAISSCNPEEPEGPVDEGKIPSVKLVADTVTATTITFVITPADAEQVRYAYYEKTSDFTAPSYTDLMTQGVETSATEPSTITVENLTTDLTYVVMVAAYGNEMTVGQTLEMIPVAEKVEVPTLPEELNLTFDSAEYDGGWIDYMMQYIYFTSEEYTFNLEIDNSELITAGTYTPSMMGEPGTFSNFSYIMSNTEPSLYAAVVDGSITIEIDGDNYKFTFDLILSNETQEEIIMKGTYEGVVTGLGNNNGNEDNPGEDQNGPDFPELPDGESDSEFFTVAWCSGITETITTLNFATTYGTRIFTMPIYPYEGYEGTYVVGWEGKVGEIDYMTSGCNDGGYPNPGNLENNINTVTITRSGENWKVEFNLKSMSDTDPIVGTYEGPITDLE